MPGTYARERLSWKSWTYNFGKKSCPISCCCHPTPLFHRPPKSCISGEKTISPLRRAHQTCHRGHLPPVSLYSFLSVEPLRVIDDSCAVDDFSEFVESSPTSLGPLTPPYDMYTGQSFEPLATSQAQEFWSDIACMWQHRP